MGNWQRTSPSLPREQRAQLTMMAGGTSIFVTFMLTLLDFVIGSQTPFPAIQRYSDFSLWTLSFDFWLQCTVFMPSLVLSDDWEKVKRNSIFPFWKVHRRTNRRLTKLPVLQILLTTYGNGGKESAKTTLSNLSSLEMESNISKPLILAEPEETAAEKFITEKLAPRLLKPWSRAIIAGLTFLYFVGSFLIVWFGLEVGFRPQDLAHTKSNAFNFIVYYHEHFFDFTDALEVQVLYNISTERFDNDFDKIRNRVKELDSQITLDESFYWDGRFNKNPIVTSLVPLGTSLEEAVALIAANETKNFQPKLENGRLIFLTTFHTRDLGEMSRGAAFTKGILTFQNTFEEDDLKIFISDHLQFLRIYHQILELPDQFIYFGLIAVAGTIVTSMVMIP